MNVASCYVDIVINATNNNEIISVNHSFIKRVRVIGMHIDTITEFRILISYLETIVIVIVIVNIRIKASACTYPRKLHKNNYIIIIRTYRIAEIFRGQ